MEEFYINLVTALNDLDPIIKCLIVGMLAMLVVMCVRNIIKSHVNPKKPIFKIGNFVLLGIIVAVTIFITVNMF